MISETPSKKFYFFKAEPLQNFKTTVNAMSYKSAWTRRSTKSGGGFSSPGVKKTMHIYRHDYKITWKTVSTVYEILLEIMPKGNCIKDSCHLKL